MKYLATLLLATTLFVGCNVLSNDSEQLVDTYQVVTMDESSSKINDVEKVISYNTPRDIIKHDTTSASFKKWGVGHVSSPSITIKVPERVKLAVIMSFEGKEVKRVIQFVDSELTVEL